jgi:PhzF family phenazine biosynthesis protein
MHRYRLVNVFVEDTAFSGNALAVFEDGAALDEPTMQAIALQLNLSETTFLFPSQLATARVRIFTPEFEMPFAGHPTLGTAHVVRALRSSGDAVPCGSTPDRSSWSCRSPRSRPSIAAGPMRTFWPGTA